MKIKSTFTPLFIFLFSFFILFNLISKDHYHVDCLILVMSAEDTLRTHQMHYGHSHGYPLIAFLSVLFVYVSKLFSGSNPIFAVNFISVLFGSLCPPALFLIVRKILDTRAALSSSLLFALSPLFLGVSTYGNSHAPVLFLLLSGIYFLLCYKESAKLKYFTLTILSLGLAGAARIQDAVIMLIPLSIAYWSKSLGNTHETSRIQNNVKRKSLLFGISIFFVALIIILFYIHPIMILPAERVEYNFYDGFLKYIITPLANLPAALVGLSFNYSLLGLLVAYFGYYILFRKHKMLFVFLLAWVLVPLLVFCNTEGFRPRFITVILPSLYIAQGSLFSWAWRKGKFSPLIVCIFIFLLSYITFSRIYPVLNFRHHHSLFSDFAKNISKKLSSDSILVTVDHGRAYSYYGNIKSIRRPATLIKKLTHAELYHFKAELDALLDKGIPVYITISNLLISYNPLQFPAFMDKHYDLEYFAGGLIEDWHIDVTESTIFLERLYRIKKK